MVYRQGECRDKKNIHGAVAGLPSIIASLNHPLQREKTSDTTKVIFNDLRIRPGVEYNYDNYLYTANKINSTGSFSMTDLQFVPRDTTSSCDTLDFTLNCVLDKPYDVYVETNYISKNTGRNGPQLVLGFAKRNAFRGGEKLSVNLNGSYEWQSGKGISGLFNPSNSETTYEYGWDATLELPRLVNSFPR